MLTSVEIEGFKSFGSQCLRVPLSPLNFIVGPNASGKTNFLAALRFLKMALSQGTEYALNELGGASEVRNKRERQRKADKYLRIRVKTDDEAPFNVRGEDAAVTVSGFDYALQIDLRASDGVPRIVEEQLLADVTKGGDTERYKLTRDTNKVVIDDPNPLSDRKKQEFTVPSQEKSRPALSAGFFSLPSVMFRQLVESWSFFNISPQIARLPYKETTDATLGAFGENLSVVLHRLEATNGKNGLNGLVAALRGVIPGFKGIKPVRDEFEGKWHLKIAEEGIRAHFSPHSISDGTVRLIALLVIASVGASRGGLIAIEEPENGLHPHVIEHIVSVFREASVVSQVIATTHNPAFLDHLTPEEVLLCGKPPRGVTRIKRADEHAEIRSFQKHFSLGELWVQGTFDGFLE